MDDALVRQNRLATFGRGEKEQKGDGKGRGVPPGRRVGDASDANEGGLRIRGAYFGRALQEDGHARSLYAEQPRRAIIVASTLPILPVSLAQSRRGSG